MVKHAKRWHSALKKRRGELAWTLASSLLGGGIGLLMATLYLWARS